MVFNVLKYIYKHNSLQQLPLRLVQSVAFQLYKRISKGIISKQLFNGKKILLFPNCTISSQ